MKTAWSRRLRVAGLLSLLLALVPAVSRAEAPWPGLPDDTIPGTATADWSGIQVRGLTEVARARQWAKIPLQATLVNLGTEKLRDYPRNDPEHRDFSRRTYLSAFFSSPAGTEHGYGISLPFTVRTAAFGAMPVQARVQVLQARDEQDLPMPIHGYFDETLYTTADHLSFYAPTTLTGRVEVRVLSLSVDGVDLALTGACRTTHAGVLTLHSEGGWVPTFRSTGPAGSRPSDADLKAYADSLASRGIFSGGGGVISGTVDVPAFIGCSTATGDDLSRLLTATVSGPANTVSVTTPNLGAVSCWTVVPPLGFQKPRGPFQGDPTVDCNPNVVPYDLPLPKRN